MDLPQPFDVRKASHSLLPRQNFAAASYAPAVKKPLRKLAVAERLAHEGPVVPPRGPHPVSVRSQYADQKPAVKKKRFLKAEKLPKGP